MSDDIEERTKRIESAKKAQEERQNREAELQQTSHRALLAWLKSLKLSDYELVMLIHALRIDNIFTDRVLILKVKQIFDEVRK